jgi:hypothetical protein
MPDIEKILRSISSEKYDDKELINLYRNTEKYDSITEENRERILEAVEVQLRERFPRVAKKALGPIGTRPWEYLEHLYQISNEKFDLTHNRVKNGVKSGGSMISGDAYIDYYISFKNAKKKGVVAHAYQVSASEPLKFQVFSYEGAARPENRSNQTEYLSECDDIYTDYLNLLSDVLE